MPMRESWSTCWYVPLLALSGVLVALLILALVFVEVLIADVPGPAQVAQVDRGTGVSGTHAQAGALTASREALVAPAGAALPRRVEPFVDAEHRAPTQSGGQHP
jgi:hypothetical protein